ncbi:hypothetical protein E4U32_000585 [Claviceps aff. humidiphila group G2b]|nr:hypothetical protein E4U32_000585 [Claviceps aff. humidiphila group G2b]
MSTKGSNFKLPSLHDIGTFDGTTPAEPFLSRLEELFKTMNDGQDVDPSTHIRAIDMSLVKGAAQFVDSSLVLQSITTRARQNEAVDQDLKEFQQAFRGTYPEESPHAELRQGEAEDLSAYYKRVLRMYKRFGARDEPVSPSEPLSLLEKYVLNSFIYRFAHGLRDKMLFLEALNRDVLGADSLTQAMERVEQAATAMEFQANLAKSHNTNLLRQHQSRSKMFNISVKVTACVESGHARTFNLNPGRVVIAGGAEISIVSRAFVTKHKIPMHDLGSVGFKGLRMGNADGRQVKVTQFAVLEVNCQGIVRSVWAVVTPDEQPRTRVVLTLGHPWLYDVGAKFDIAGSKLTIGIQEEGDTITTIQGPKVALSPRQGMVLCPADPSALDKYVGWIDEDNYLEHLMKIISLARQ